MAVALPRESRRANTAVRTSRTNVPGRFAGIRVGSWARVRALHAGQRDPNIHHIRRENSGSGNSHLIRFDGDHMGLFFLSCSGIGGGGWAGPAPGGGALLAARGTGISGSFVLSRCAAAAAFGGCLRVLGAGVSSPWWRAVGCVLLPLFGGLACRSLPLSSAEVGYFPEAFSSRSRSCSGVVLSGAGRAVAAQPHRALAVGAVAGLRFVVSFGVQVEAYL